MGKWVSDNICTCRYEIFWGNVVLVCFADYRQEHQMTSNDLERTLIVA